LFTVVLPITVAPSRNWTVPVAPAGVTAATKVTDCPTTAGFRDEARVTLEAALLIVTGRAAELLAVSSESPL
jgi:hypothetical protein